MCMWCVRAYVCVCVISIRKHMVAIWQFIAAIHFGESGNWHLLLSQCIYLNKKFTKFFVRAPLHVSRISSK